MSAPLAPAVVLGVGNVLLRDDAAGVRVIEELRRFAELDPTALPAATRLVDGGTLGADLLQAVASARCLVIVDAVDLGKEPGTVVVLRGDAITGAGDRRSGSAPGGVGELLAIARLMGWLPGPVALVGIQIEEIGFDVGLSAAVQGALPVATARVVDLLRTLEDELATRPDAPAIAGLTRAIA